LISETYVKKIFYLINSGVNNIYFPNYIPPLEIKRIKFGQKIKKKKKKGQKKKTKEKGKKRENDKIEPLTAYFSQTERAKLP